ncbi:hypothetical protein ACFOX0_04900 [Micromonospora zhanjiangensis]|uniref:Membrane protein involved in the export of O-antigen and teichoic acid n=1 Tax=Micromonospora zhanjiangensis TaxID=1522057 RepID=A0ABV8KGP4_9ACTN
MTTLRGKSAVDRAGLWSGLALGLGQFALMGTSLILSLSLAYAGGLAAVGAIASAVLVFQLTCGVLQRTLAEATLFAQSHADATADLLTCRRAVGTALLGGGAGAVVALLAGLAIPGARLGLVLAYVVGIPFAIALDIGRSAGVAAGAARGAFVETAAWLAVQVGAVLTCAAFRSPMGVCLSWTVTNVLFVALAATAPHRRPSVSGLLGWTRARAGSMGPASVDALLNGLAPLLAIQAAALVTTAATLGEIRVFQQVFAPLVFVSITLRRMLVYRRSPDTPVRPGQDLRDGLVATALMAAGAVVIGLAVLAGHALVPALGFIPVGLVLVAAGLEKAALGLSFGCSLGMFVRGRWRALLRTRYVMIVATLIAVPPLTAWWGASGFLVGSAAGMVVYSVMLVAQAVPPSDEAARVPS